MKYIVAIFCLGFVAFAYAKETKTNCMMMNEDTREKIIKEPSSVSTNNQKARSVRM